MTGLSVLAGTLVSACGAPTEEGRAGQAKDEMIRPVRTGLSDWTGVAGALGRGGQLKHNVAYYTPLPRSDLAVVSRGVTVRPALALSSHIGFVRYSDGGSLLMGDVVVTEQELQQFIDVLQEHGIELTAIHKHLPSQTPAVWGIHVHAHGDDPVAIARGLRTAFDRTGTPPARPPARQRPLDLDTSGIDTALGVKGSVYDGVYRNFFARRETVTEGGMVLPPALGSTTNINFQPLGHGRAAISGDCVMVASEVQNVLKALRHAGVELVELHNHGLRDEPRLFFTHFWATGDAVTLARRLRPAVDATNVVPIQGAG
ncbi:DUF1259 domain-containing protein [Streptomyces sp. NPDC047009]|uniref:DUF1259 domain-containing protein n=2 Tax=Streptomyces TaxID=1883 RepID=UPI0033E5AA2C